MATFTLDATIEPTYIDILDVAQGYGVFSLSIDDILPGDQVQMVALVVVDDTNTEIFAKAIDQVQRSDGWYEYITQSEIAAHFTLLPADIALIAGSSDEFTYSVVATILRSGSTYEREVQGGAIAARPTTPLPPLIVNSITLAGGPTSGAPGTTHQLTATTKDGLGNTITGVPVAWASTDIAVATVDVNGLVHFVTPGTVTITATSQGLTATTTATTSITPTPSNNDILVWVSVDSQWEPFPLLWSRVLSTPTTLLGYGLVGPSYALGTNASGSNAAATSVSLVAPLSTGTAAPATLTIETTEPGVSGSTPQIPTSVATFDYHAATFPYGVTVTGSSFANVYGLSHGGDITGLPPSMIGATDHVGLLLACGAGMLADFVLQNSAQQYVMAVGVGGTEVAFAGSIAVAGGTSALQALTATTGMFSSQLSLARWATFLAAPGGAPAGSIWSDATNGFEFLPIAGSSLDYLFLDHTGASLLAMGPGAIGIAGAVNATGAIDATGGYKVGGVAGANFSGVVTNITIVKGIVTAVS